MSRRRPLRFPHDVTVYEPTGARPQHRIVWRDPTTGQRRTAWRTSRADAVAAAEDVSRQLGSKRAAADTRVRPDLTVSDLLDHYLNPATRRRPWSLSHARERATVVNTWLRPTLGDIPCRDLTANHVRAALDTMRTRGATANRATRALTVLKAVTRVGVEDGWLEHDPAAAVAPPAGTGRGRRVTAVTSSPDSRQVTAAAEAYRDPLAVQFAAYTGLRLGEQLELRAADIDVAAGTIRVRRQLLRPADTSPHIHLPKWGKPRVTFLPGHLAAAVTERLEDVAGNPPAPDPACGCDLAADPPDSPLLFPAASRPDRHQRPSNMNRSAQGWAAARTAAGWDPAWTWHDLRHHFCEWCLAAPPDGLGLEVADVAEFAGHDTPDVTWRMYVRTRGGAVDRARRASERHRP